MNATPNTTKLAEEIAQIILDDTTDRQGLGDEWNLIDADIKEEIILTWIELIKEKLDKTN